MLGKMIRFVGKYVFHHPGQYSMIGLSSFSNRLWIQDFTVGRKS